MNVNDIVLSLRNKYRLIIAHCDCIVNYTASPFYENDRYSTVFVKADYLKPQTFSITKDAITETATEAPVTVPAVTAELSASENRTIQFNSFHLN